MTYVDAYFSDESKEEYLLIGKLVNYTIYGILAPSAASYVVPF